MATVALAWAGLVIHNVADLPDHTVFSLETLVPTLVWLLTFGLAVVPETRKVGLWALLGWATVNLVGGALSVLPLAILPFAPEQTARHYAFHGMYAATQIPLIVLAAVLLRHSVTHSLDRANTSLGRGQQAAEDLRIDDVASYVTTERSCDDGPDRSRRVSPPRRGNARRTRSSICGP